MRRTLARVGVGVGAFTAVGVWAWVHGTFNGSNLLALILIGAAITVLWCEQAKPSPCPHCRDCLHHVTEPTQQRRGDGI